jgi:hypothetical protein
LATTELGITAVPFGEIMKDLVSVVLQWLIIFLVGYALVGIGKGIIHGLSLLSMPIRVLVIVLAVAGVLFVGLQVRRKIAARRRERKAAERRKKLAERQERARVRVNERENGIRWSAEDLVYGSERLLSKQGARLTEDEFKAVEGSLANLKTALEGTDLNTIKNATKRLATANQAASQRIEKAAERRRQRQIESMSVSHIRVRIPLDADDFETVCFEFLTKLGHTNAYRTAKGPDGGVDIGSDTAVGQAKFHPSQKVSAEPIRALAGARMQWKKREAFFFHYGPGYTPDAIEAAKQLRVRALQLDVNRRVFREVQRSDDVLDGPPKWYDDDADADDDADDDAT